MSIKDQKCKESVSVEGDGKDSLNMNLNFYLVATALVAAISGFNAGFNSAIVNIPAKTIYKCTEVISINGLPSCIQAKELNWGVVIAMFALGGGFGSLGASKALEVLGRRRSLMANNLLFILGGVLIATATTLGQMGVGRFVVGAGSGFATVAVSTYVGEISPTKGRGAMGTILQFMVVVGILIGQVISMGMNSPTLWRYLFALTVIPSTAQIFMLMFCVESPRYLIARNQIEGARSTLAKLRSGHVIDNEFNAIVEGQKGKPIEMDTAAEFGIAEEKNITTLEAMKELFQDPIQFKYLIIALILHLTQQFSGINGVIFYSNSIFERSFGEEQATNATIGVGCLNLVVTILSVFMVDRLGRKVLLLASLSGMTIMSALIVIGSIQKIDQLVIAGVMMFVGTFAIGLGSVPWLIMPEIFPTRTLAAASAICMGTNWFANFIVSLLFPEILKLTGDYTFVIFAAITASAAFVVLTFVPETKGRSIEDILASARQ